jgi:hypothetical protein
LRSPDKGSDHHIGARLEFPRVHQFRRPTLRRAFADAAFDNFYMGWAQVDQAIRVLNKQPLIEPHGEGTPFAIITKDNLPPPGGECGTKVDYRAKFLSLWK